MAAVVADDVADGIRDLPARFENTGVKAIGEDAAAPAQVPIEPARDAHRESLHPARQGARVVGLDDQMQMVPWIE